MKWTLINPAGTNDPETGDIYSGLDRFGRVKDNRWLDGAGADLDRIQYGYDRASNRIWRRNVVAAALGKEFDDLYGYDGIHRLKHMARGTLNGSRTALTSETFAQCWTLDSTGNWQGFREDDTGNGTWDLVQQRSANAVNEISGISETTGPSWVTPAYSRAGNMTTMPQPADPTQSYTATYDAWNRLVKIADGADTLSEYAYDGAKRRIVQKSYSGGVLDETRHLYYTEPSQWQVIEERLGTSPDSADADRQFVWGLRYIDDLVLRDRDTDGNGSLDERLYACQDANWNVTAIVDATEAMQERYAYRAYGQPLFLAPEFEGQVSTTMSWSALFAGYSWDAATQLFHVRNREFHFSLGDWQQRDPLGLQAGTNLYTYCDNTPAATTDPMGLVGGGGVGGPGQWTPPPPNPSQNCCSNCNEAVGANVLLQLAVTGIDGGDDLSGGNPFRHCLATCQATKACGSSCARKFWTEREKNPRDPADSQDLMNNEDGYSCAASSSCWDCCMRSWGTGNLTCTINTAQGPQQLPCAPPPGWQQPSGVCYDRQGLPYLCP
jgi:RHS repeat-associated protein